MSIKFRVTLVLIFGTILMQAQVNSVSPFSLFGLGDKSNGIFAQQQGMGGVFQALRSPYSVNLGNPASYSALDLVTVDFGGVQKFVWQSKGNSDPVANSTGYFNYLAFGFPVTNKWGMAVAITPYSIIGYDIRTTLNLPSYGQTTYKFTGSGGINKVTWGNSVNIYKGLSLGLNANYLFGTTDTRRDAEFADRSIYSTRLRTETTVSDIGFDLGAQYEKTWNSPRTRAQNPENLKDNHDRFFIVGATFGFGSNLNAMQSGVNYTYAISNQGVEVPQDTGSFYQDLSGSIKLPTSVGGGIAYGKRVPELKINAWKVEADFNMVQWGGFEPFDGSPSGLTDSWRASLGGYFIPNYTFGNTSRRGNYFESIKYRFGMFYENTNLSFNNEPVPDYGFTFGMDLPFKAKSADPNDVKLSTLNIGIVFGRRGLRDNGSLNEQYINLYFGINLNDKWFRKFKYR